VGMIGSYVVLWTAFFVDNAHQIPGLNQLPPLTFWVLPTLIGIRSSCCPSPALSRTWLCHDSDEALDNQR
jgi:hypothetical protein